MDPSALTSSLEHYFATQAPAGIVAAFLFGSHARGASHADSDVDVAMLLDHASYRALGDPLDLRARLGSALIHVTGSDHVDVVLMNEATPPLNKVILDEGRSLVVRDERALEQFRLVTYSRAFDLQPWLDRWRAEQMRRVYSGALHHASPTETRTAATPDPPTRS